jgi:hypothetical protein
MHKRGIRGVIAMGGAAALSVILAACSGSSGHVNASPQAPSSGDGSATSSTVTASGKSTPTTKAAAKTKAHKGAAAKPGAKKGALGGTHPGSGTNVSSVNPSGPGATTRGGTIGSPTTQPSGTTSPVTTPRTTTTTIPGPRPYDPSKPIDLGGEPGVTLAEQHRAEQLVRDTLRDLPRYATTAAAYADGYRSIGDGFTGTEHYIKWAYVNDGHILDSKLPESLVYQMRNGVQTLVSAMYMLPLGSRFTDAPDVGGALTQWHIHSTLCLVDNPSDPLQKVVGGLTRSDGTCPPGSEHAASTPMLHVWIVSNPCGPFAALEGIEGGEIPPGETRLCDTGHGAP